MRPVQQALIALYLVAVLTTVLYVPWTGSLFGYKTRIRYGLIFSPPYTLQPWEKYALASKLGVMLQQPKVGATEYSVRVTDPNIEYGTVLLELIAVNCVAGLVWVFKHRL